MNIEMRVLPFETPTHVNLEYISGKIRVPIKVLNPDVYIEMADELAIRMGVQVLDDATLCIIDQLSEKINVFGPPKYVLKNVLDILSK